MMEERRANTNPLDIAGVLAVLYTIGYLTMVGLLFFIELPASNKDPVLQLFGLMSAIQMALIGFYYGGSKQAEAVQRSIEQRQGRSAAVVEELAKVALTTGGTGPGAVTPAPMTPEGIIPAAEVAAKEKTDTEKTP